MEGGGFSFRPLTGIRGMGSFATLERASLSRLNSMWKESKT